MTDKKNKDEIKQEETVLNQEKMNKEDNVKDNKEEKAVELTVEEQLEKTKSDLLLAIADMQNMRKRTDEEIINVRKYGASNLARDLLSVADNLRMALISITDEDKEKNQALKNLSFGLDMVAKDFYSAFEKNGIKQVLPNVGDNFDHNQHQVMDEVETEEVKKGKIAQVLSAGYTLHNRLLKPAMVNVAKGIVGDKK
ncbi:nucleotide exchange factor GrpE [Alphaproteobacteria bacterium]|nr:nucleotide exchange factor GrpE [Alphaproteobacteria bacterium]